MYCTNITLKTKKAMTKDEVSLLLDLIESKPIITSKETNASSNKLKEEAWNSLTDSYNAKNGQFPRHKDQLRAKWDNLKKAARKRCQQIRLNNLKTGGGKPDFIPHDEILDRVTGQLGSTCTGFTVPFGGDGVGCTEEVVGCTEEVVGCTEEVVGCTEEVVLLDGAGVGDGISSDIPIDEVVFDEITTPETKYISLPLPISEAKKRKADGALKPRCLYGMTSMSKELQNKGKKKKYDEDGRREMHLAIQRYYEAKTVKANLEIDLLRLDLVKKTSLASTSSAD